MKKKQISRNLLPVEMQEHWNAEEYLKESEESFTILVRENVSGILCVLKFFRN